MKRTECSWWRVGEERRKRRTRRWGGGERERERERGRRIEAGRQAGDRKGYVDGIWTWQ